MAEINGKPWGRQFRTFLPDLQEFQMASSRPVPGQFPGERGHAQRKRPHGGYLYFHPAALAFPGLGGKTTTSSRHSLRAGASGWSYQEDRASV
jgi:hypothetical protein